MIDKHLASFSRAAAAVAALLVAAAPSFAATIAHWSFDTATITTDGGGIIQTAADETGNHNGALHTAGAGGSLTSVAGQFGQAAQFTNTAGSGQTNYSALAIPNLTEITGAAGGSFTVAGWINTTTINGNSPMLADWGALPTNSAGNNNFSYWFSLNNSSNNALARAQIRNSTVTTPSSGSASGIAGTYTDIAARQPAGALQGAWHHLAWTWNKSSKQLITYVDGVQVESNTSSQTNVDISPSGYTSAFLGFKQDNRSPLNGMLDEVWVFNNILSLTQIQNLRLTNVAVPEPSALAAAWIAGGALVAFRRRPQ